MKLDTWQLIDSIIKAGGVLEDGAYQVRNSFGQLHRDDGPAIAHPDGRQYWYRNGYAIPARPGPKPGPARSSGSPNGAQNEDLSSL